MGLVFGHDYDVQLAILGNIAMEGHDGSREDEAEHLMYHLGSIVNAFDMLSGEHETYVQPRDKIVFEYMGKVLRTVNSRKQAQISETVDSIRAFRTAYEIIYTMVHNLVKNSFQHDGLAQVQLQVSAFSGPVPDLVYTPDSAATEGDFIRIAVHDNGPGFPQDQALESFLELNVSSKERGGFGLFFTKMAAKHLSASLAIHSEPGNTSVALYHPTNLS